MSNILIGEILLEQGFIDGEKLKEALDIQNRKRQTGEDKKIGEILVDEGWLDEGILLDALVIQDKKKNES